MSLNISKNERRKKIRKGLNIFVSVMIYTKPVNKITACHSLILSATFKEMGNKPMKLW